MSTYLNGYVDDSFWNFGRSDYEKQKITGPMQWVSRLFSKEKTTSLTVCEAACGREYYGNSTPSFYIFHYMYFSDSVKPEMFLKFFARLFQLHKNPKKTHNTTEATNIAGTVLIANISDKLQFSNSYCNRRMSVLKCFCGRGSQSRTAYVTL